MTFPDYVNMVLKMIAEGNENHEIFEQLQKLGLREGEITEGFNPVLGNISSGPASTEQIIHEQ